MSSGPTATVPLRVVAHSRSGDKGDTLNLSLIALRPEFYPILAAQVTPERVRAHFAGRRPRRVRRYELPNLGALNFVLEGFLDGGVNYSLNLDGHGKTLSSRLLELEVLVPAALLPDLAHGQPSKGGAP